MSKDIMSLVINKGVPFVEITIPLKPESLEAGGQPTLEDKLAVTRHEWFRRGFELEWAGRVHPDDEPSFISDIRRATVDVVLAEMIFGVNLSYDRTEELNVSAEALSAGKVLGASMGWHTNNTATSYTPQCHAAQVLWGPEYR